MRYRSLFVASVVALLLSGCASFPVVRDWPCLPPDVSPEFFAWPARMARSSMAVDAEGNMREIVLVRYERDGQAVQVLWIDGLLALVDPAPDAETPPLLDRGIIADGQLLPRGESRCEWVAEFPGRPRSERMQ